MASPIPRFWKSEIQAGKILGSGSFCTAIAVKDVTLHSDPSPEEADDGQQKQRHQLAQRFSKARQIPKPSQQELYRLAIYGKSTDPPVEMDDPEQEPAPKLALKCIRVNELRPDDLRTAQDDFQRELNILAELGDHPNIIELYGIGYDDESKENEESFPTDVCPSFLILSQIRSTLSKRLVKWRDNRGFGLFEMLSIDVNNRRNRWTERVLLLSKVAHALKHVHSHKIIYRDIKPDNVGFCDLGIPKLFDFGLAKRVTDAMRYRNGNKEEEPLEEGLFHLTPETGTLRYMSVENGKGRPYGWSSDVFSLAILMHEVLTLKVPFGGISPRQFRQVVWNEGRALDIDHSWPDLIQDILPRMWSFYSEERPGIDEVVQTLDMMLRGKDEDLFPKGLISHGRKIPFIRSLVSES